jgi:hypothetical protein
MIKAENGVVNDLKIKLVSFFFFFLTVWYHLNIIMTETVHYLFVIKTLLHYERYWFHISKVLEILILGVVRRRLTNKSPGIVINSKGVTKV